MAGNVDNPRIDDSPGCGGGILTRQIATDAKEIALGNRKAIDQLKNRLPVWATALISVLTFFLGCSVTYAALAAEVAEKMGQ